MTSTPEAAQVAVDDFATAEEFAQAVDATIKYFNDGDIVSGTVLPDRGQGYPKFPKDVFVPFKHPLERSLARSVCISDDGCPDFLSGQPTPGVEQSDYEVQQPFAWRCAGHQVRLACWAGTSDARTRPGVPSR